IINDKHAGTAAVSRDGRIILTSPTNGAGSKLLIEPPKAGAKPDAARALGFVGASAVSEPNPLGPARLSATGKQQGFKAVNLTSTLLELHLPTGTIAVPARGSVPLSPADAAHVPLQRLIAQGMLRLAAND